MRSITSCSSIKAAMIVASAMARQTLAIRINMSRCYRRSSLVFRIGAFQVSKVSNYCVREIGEEVEFVTIMLFDSLGSFREFAGEDYA